MLLALETSSRAGSVATYDLSSGALLQVRALEGMKNHGAALAPTVAELIPKIEAVQAYAITVGPGSFTGLRIGIAFLKGLGVVHPKPAYPISTFEVIATQLAEAKPQARALLCVLDARKKEVFAAFYTVQDGALVLDPRLSPGVYPAQTLANLENIEDIEELAVGGDEGGIGIAKAILPQASGELITPSAKTVGKLACAHHQRGAGVDLLSVEPVYYQLSAAEVNLGKIAKL